MRTSDDIGDLTLELNTMAAELEVMRSDLEARVRARTREFVRAARLAGVSRGELQEKIREIGEQAARGVAAGTLVPSRCTRSSMR